MSRSTDTGFRWARAVAALLLCLGGMGACSTLEMPTPIEHVRTTNVVAPSYEHRPPPLPDGGASGETEVAGEEPAGAAPAAGPDAGAGAEP